MSHPKRKSSSGFTLLEVLFAMMVMSVGLVGLSTLAASSLNRTATARYDSLAAMLASEKLEDLNRWPTWDPNVCVASGSTSGSLTADDQVTTETCTGSAGTTVTNTATINYFDDVALSDSSGQVCETVSVLVGSTQEYKATCHNPDGTMTLGAPTTTANAADVGAIAFHRRWTIEMDQPVTGVKRMTVLVTLENGYIKPGVSFQMSTVRP